MTSRAIAPLVSIVDDDSVVAEAIARLLQTQGLRTEKFHEAESFLESRELGYSACVVLDVQMPGKSGLDVLEVLAAKFEMPPVVLVTGHGDVPMCVRAMRQGAFHVLEKPFVPGELVSIVKSAVHRTLVRRAQQGIPADLESRLASLDAEEQQILELVLAGKVNKQIAHMLNKGERTVQFRVSSLLSKLGMPTRKRLASTLSNVRRSSFLALMNATADI